MFSRSAKQSVFRNATQRIRHQSTVVGQRATIVAQKPLQSSVWGFVFKTLFYGGLAYTTAATVALNYEPFQEFFIENVPYGEEYMDNLAYAWKHKQEITSFNYAAFYKNKKNEIIGDINTASEKVGLGAIIDAPVVPTIEKSIEEKKPTKEDQFLVLSDVPKKVEKKIEETKIAIVESANKLSLPTIAVETSDSEIKKAVESLNSLIMSINSTDIGEKSEKSIQSIKEHLTKVSQNYHKIISGKTADIQELKEAELKKYQTELAHEKVELTKHMTAQLEEAKKIIEDKFSKKLQVEIDSTKTALALEAQNIILNSKTQITEDFIQIIEQAVASERDSKLKDLDVIASRVDRVEALEQELSKNALSFQNYKAIQKTIASIQRLLTCNEPSSTRGPELIAQLKQLKSLTSLIENPLIQATLSSFPDDKEILLNGGTLTQSQLIERWNLLAPELRSVSLLPENAGLLGYFASDLFSKLLFTKSGVPEKSQDVLMGNDIEAVISRVNNYLQKNQLDNAVEEVSLLKGAARQLSEDWLVESRRKLEIQFLTDLLDTEVHVTF